MQTSLTCIIIFLHAVSFEDGAEVELQLDADTFLQPGESFMVGWSPEGVLPEEDPSSSTVDITLHCLDPSSGDAIETVSLATNAPNNGSAQVTIPAVASISDVSMCSVQVTAATVTAAASTALLRRVVALWSPVSYLVISVGLRLGCHGWHKAQSPATGAKLLASVMPCPNNVQQARADSRFSPDNPITARIFHRGSESCFRQNVP